MTAIHRFLSIPFPFFRARAAANERKAPERKPKKQPSSIAAEPNYSRRFRLERECARYRSIHFPR